MKINRDEQEGIYHSEGREIGGSNPLTPTLFDPTIFDTMK